MNFPHLKNKISQLETNRLNLRPLLPEDASFFYKFYQKPKIAKYALINFASMNEVSVFVQKYSNYGESSQFRIIIEVKPSLLPIGSICIINWSIFHHSAEIGYDLDPQFWKQGFMTEALTIFIDLTFKVMNLNRLEATANPENDRSVNLLERLGFQKEGLFRQKYFARGEFRDEIAFALLKSDWLKKQGKY